MAVNGDGGALGERGAGDRKKPRLEADFRGAREQTVGAAAVTFEQMSEAVQEQRRALEWALAGNEAPGQFGVGSHLHQSASKQDGSEYGHPALEWAAVGQQIFG